MTRQDIIALALAKLDEVSTLSQGEDFSVSALVDDLMNDSVVNMLRNAPLTMLTPIKVNVEGDNFIHQINTDGTGYVVLPASFVRLYSFKMAAWSRPVEAAISIANPLYKLQHNSVTRGKSTKPVVAINFNTTGTGIDDPDLPLDPDPSGWTALPPLYISDQTLYHGSKAGERHIPTGGELNQLLAFQAPSGNAAWSFMTDSIHGNRGGGFLHELATESEHGFMSSYDKAKLNTIQEGANYYEHPNTQGFKHIPQGGQAKDMLVWSYPGTAVWIDPATILELKIEPGTENQFFSWDKTWRQINYSMLGGDISFNDLSDTIDYTFEDAGKFVRVNSGGTGLEYATVDVDLSNYVTIDVDDEQITGRKYFSASTRFASINIGAGTYRSYIQIGTLTANTLFQLPINNGSNGQVLTTNGSGVTSWNNASGSKWTDVTLNSQNYIQRNGRVIIGNEVTGAFTTSVLTIKALTQFTSDATSVWLEKDYNYFLAKIDAHGGLHAGRSIEIGGSESVSRRGSLNPYLRFKYPSDTGKSISFYMLSEPASNVTFYLPTSDGTNGQALVTNGAGTLTWSTVGSGSTYTVFTNTANGLVPYPNISDGTTKVLTHNGTTHSWTTLSTGVTTRVRLNESSYRTGDITLQTVNGNAISITEPYTGVFQFVHADTSTVATTSTSGFNIISSLNFDDYGHVVSISTRSLLPTTSNGYFLRDDGEWIEVDGGVGLWSVVTHGIKTSYRVGINADTSVNEWLKVKGNVVIDGSDVSSTYTVSVSGQYGLNVSSTGNSEATIQAYSSGGNIGIKSIADVTVAGMFISKNVHAIHAIRDSIYTNTAEPILSLVRETSGTAADGIGALIEFGIKNAAGNVVYPAYLGARFKNAATGATEIVFYLGSTVRAKLTDEFDFQLTEGNNIIPSNKAYYLGEKTTDGSWRMQISGSDLIMQRRIAGSWVTKNTITG